MNYMVKMNIFVLDDKLKMINSLWGNINGWLVIVIGYLGNWGDLKWSYVIIYSKIWFNCFIIFEMVIFF